MSAKMRMGEERLVEIEALIEKYDRSQMEDDAMRELLAEVCRLRRALERIRDGNWNVGRQHDITIRKFVREALRGADPDVAEQQHPLIAEALQWRAWATGERKDPPHNLLAFTTDVIDVVTELQAVATTEEEP